MFLVYLSFDSVALEPTTTESIFPNKLQQLSPFILDKDKLTDKKYVFSECNKRMLEWYSFRYDNKFDLMGIRILFSSLLSSVYEVFTPISNDDCLVLRSHDTNGDPKYAVYGIYEGTQALMNISFLEKKADVISLLVKRQLGLQSSEQVPVMLTHFMNDDSNDRQSRNYVQCLMQ